MGIFLDSANPDDARRAQQLGFLEGVTTNHDLIAQTERPGLDVLAELVEIVTGHVLYQVMAETAEGRYDEAWEAHKVRPDKVIVKLPATTGDIAMASRLVQNGIECAITAVASPAQAYLAAQANASYVTPFVNRLTREAGNGLKTVQNIRAMLAESDTEIIAASLTSVDEAVAVLLAGAQHVTLPLELILDMGEHSFTQQVIADYTVDRTGGLQSSMLD